MPFLKKLKKKTEEAVKKGLEVGEKGAKKGVKVGKKAGKKGVELGKKGVKKTRGCRITRLCTLFSICVVPVTLDYFLEQTINEPGQFFLETC